MNSIISSILTVWLALVLLTIRAIFKSLSFMPSPLPFKLHHDGLKNRDKDYSNVHVVGIMSSLMKRGIYPRIVIDESYFEVPILSFILLWLGFVPWSRTGCNISESHLTLIQGKREPFLFVLSNSNCFPSEIYTRKDIIDIAPEAHLYSKLDETENKTELSDIIKFGVRLNYKIISVSGIGFESVWDKRFSLPLSQWVNRSLYESDSNGNSDNSKDEECNLTIPKPSSLLVLPKRFYLKFSGNLNSELVTNIDRKKSGSPAAVVCNSSSTEQMINDYYMSIVDGISFLCHKKLNDPLSNLMALYTFRSKAFIEEWRKSLIF